MKGLELCRSYYYEVGKPELTRRFPEAMSRAAAGLSGQGSDCLGLDDEYSRDHDFGPGFCLWLSDADFDEYGAAMQAAYDALPKEYMGFARKNTHTGAQRVGVMRTADFYRYYIGCPGVPDTLMRWVRIQEHFLATCTSGQSGQYNYPRLMRRGDPSGARLALAEFLNAALSMLYLLNFRYEPFYKWQFAGAKELVAMSDALPYLREIACLSTRRDGADIVSHIENVAGAAIRELKLQGLTDAAGDYLEPHAHSIMSKIADPEIRGLHVMEG